MTRRSKREIKRALEQLDTVETSVSETSLEEYHSDDVVRTVQALARDLLRIRYQNPDAIVNAREPDATLTFLEIIRERYNIDDDSDEDVRLGLEDAVAGRDYSTSVDGFAMALFAIAKQADIETDDGESLEDLVDASREQIAERLLVRRTYETFANAGGRRSEVTA